MAGSAQQARRGFASAELAPGDDEQELNQGHP